MTHRREYHRDRMRRKRWPESLAMALARLEALVTDEQARAGRALPELPPAVLEAWDLRHAGDPFLDDSLD